MHIYKMHGTGNDFILLDNLKEEALDYSELAKVWCDRHFGIGADGILVILPSKKADLKMRILNSDGTESEMCGNGVRCFARHAYEKRLVSTPRFRLETLAGIVEPECILEQGKVVKVRANLGAPRYGDLHPRADESLSLKSENLIAKIELPEGIVEGATISMGNPHFVIFGDQQKHPWELRRHGEILAKHKTHPRGSNVEFVEVLSPGQLRVSVWERGAGPTMACGTGACASVAAARILKNFPEKVRVEMPGGPLDIEWDGVGPVFLTGAANYVFEGDISKELGKLPQLNLL